MRAGQPTAARAARITLPATSSSSSASVRGSTRTRPRRSARRAAGRRRAGRRRASPGPSPGASTATAGPGSSSSGSAPPPTRATASITSPPVCVRKRAGTLLERLARDVEHRQHRDLAPRALGVAVQRERGGERGERQATDPQGARERVAAAGLDRIGGADEDPRLRAAEQLVAAEARQRGAGRDRAAHRRLVRERGQLGERARADVVDHRGAECAQHFDADVLHEPDGAEVRLVDAQDHGVAVRARERALVVGAARAVRRADLDQPRARLRDRPPARGTRRRSRRAGRGRRSRRAPLRPSAATASSAAPAALLTASPSSAPVSSRSSPRTCASRWPRRPSRRSSSRSA